MNHQAQPDASSHRPFRYLLLLEGVALAALLVFWFAGGSSTAAPNLNWKFGDTGGAKEPFASLPADFPVRLEVELPGPMHVYVASHDTLRGNVALWPSTQLKSDLLTNPLAKGRHVLPGRYDRKDVEWHVGDGVGVTTFMVIASVEPIADLASAMKRFRQMGNAAFPDRRQCATYAPDGGMSLVPPRSEIAHELLKRCAEEAPEAHDGPMIALDDRPGVFMMAMRVVTPVPEEAMTAEQVKQKLAERLGPLQSTPPPAMPGGETQGQVPMPMPTPPTTGR